MVARGFQFPMEERLDKIEMIPFCGCWFWMGSTNADGYGVVAGSFNGKRYRIGAHRASYLHFVGPIPEGKHICHHCDIPCCINPYHLYVGDPTTNGMDKARRKRAKTTPKFGKDNPMYGKIGPLNPFYGKTHTEESKQKMSLTLKLTNSK